MQQGIYHVPVLLHEAIDGLNILPAGTYVDCTFGSGGHSNAILSRLNQDGKLVAFDQDETAKQNVPEDKRLIFISNNFRHLRRFLRLNHITKVNGILADLGVSSHQFDSAERGFSTRHDAAIDMRMDQRQSLTAAGILATYPEEKLHKIFEQYGEVTNAKTLAKTIAESRKATPLLTTKMLRNVIYPVVKGNPNKYLAQVFQALRIELNDELGALKEMLEQVPELLLPGGRVAVITFHSLEDRLVKRFFRDGTFEETHAGDLYGTRIEKGLRPVNKKPLMPAAEELKANPRARSARLRIAEKNEM